VRFVEEKYFRRQGVLGLSFLGRFAFSSSTMPEEYRCSRRSDARSAPRVYAGAEPPGAAELPGQTPAEGAIRPDRRGERPQLAPGVEPAMKRCDPAPA
jgi:hypothetical protein